VVEETSVLKQTPLNKRHGKPASPTKATPVKKVTRTLAADFPLFDFVNKDLTGLSALLTVFPLVALLAGDFFGVATFSSVCVTITVSSSTVIVTFSTFFGVGAFLRVPLFAGDFAGVFTFLVTIFPPLPRVSFNGDFLGVAIFFGDVVFTGAFPLVRFAAGDLTGVCGFTPVKKTTRGKAKRVKSPVKTEEGVAQVGKTVVDNVKPGSTLFLCHITSRTFFTSRFCFY
jgi:hypothetical protein